MAALITLLDMATENSSPTGLDCPHDTVLRHRHRSAIVQAIVCAVAVQYIRYFQLRTIHLSAVALELPQCGRIGLNAKRLWEQIERAFGRADLGSGDA